jgi:hypothetical protein
MNQEFKLQYDFLGDNDQKKSEAETKHKSESYARNVCFVHLNGKMLFLNYGYLVSADYDPEDNSITLNFTSHTIILRGSKLDSMYLEFFHHIPKVVSCLEERYNQTENERPVINNIEVEKL